MEVEYLMFCRVFSFFETGKGFACARISTSDKDIVR